MTEEILPIKKHTRLNLMGLPSNTDYNDLGGGNYFLRFGKIINWHQLFEIGQILMTRIEDDRSGRKKLEHFMRYIIALFLRSNTLLQRLGGGKYFLRFGKTINCHSVV